eukprot:933482-Prorocentrum_minimum.AAC.1
MQASAVLSAGAAVDTTSSSGYSPLYVAAAGGHVEVVRLLLRAGADIHKYVPSRQVGVGPQLLLACSPTGSAWGW